MSESNSTPPVQADKLVEAYIRIRDTRSTLKQQYETADAALKEQHDVIKSALLDVCRTTGMDGGKTEAGTFTRTVRTRYWTSDWASMHAFCIEHNALSLLERRISQSAMKQFLEENPTLLPTGLNADSEYDIVVRRKTGS
jgi:hypothetical protein